MRFFEHVSALTQSDLIDPKMTSNTAVTRPFSQVDTPRPNDEQAATPSQNKKRKLGY
jgi:hypothetical protein